jgi:hypothetical protein
VDKEDSMRQHTMRLRGAAFIALLLVPTLLVAEPVTVIKAVPRSHTLHNSGGKFGGSSGFTGNYEEEFDVKRL